MRGDKKINNKALQKKILYQTSKNEQKKKKKRKNVKNKHSQRNGVPSTL